MLDAEKIRSDFPILEREIKGRKLVYLDSTATSQRPRQVIEAVSGFEKTKNANVARSIHTLAEEATAEYENARKKTAKFINAEESREVIFTRNTTESLNLVMRGWGEKFVKEGDRIVSTIMEHHSNFVPWQQLAKRRKAKFEVIDIDGEGKLREDELDRIKGAKIFAFSATSNVLGTINDVKRLCKVARDEGAVSVVDGAQSVPGMPTDVQDMGCDFLAFSGHKMLAPFGIGVLYGRGELLGDMDPFIYGSEMIKKVDKDLAVWNDLPLKFEAGTPSVDEAVGLGAAIDYLSGIGMENVRKHEEELAGKLLETVGEMDGVRFFGPGNANERTGLLAFEVEGVHPHDIAALLDEEGIAIRTGHHCAMPLHLRIEMPGGTNRAGTYIYNTAEEIDYLAESLRKIMKMLKG
jgi:cysteine desulfurase/selenocysteine lyase